MKRSQVSLLVPLLALLLVLCGAAALLLSIEPEAAPNYDPPLYVMLDNTLFSLGTKVEDVSVLDSYSTDGYLTFVEGGTPDENGQANFPSADGARYVCYGDGEYAVHISQSGSSWYTLVPVPEYPYF